MYKDPERQRAYCREHYKNNKEAYAESKKKTLPARRKRNRVYVARLKLEAGCSKCSYNEHPAALDYHHTKDKNMSIARLAARQVSLKTLDKEIAKCVVLCANCHRVEHAPVSQLVELQHLKC